MICLFCIISFIFRLLFLMSIAQHRPGKYRLVFCQTPFVTPNHHTGSGWHGARSLHSSLVLPWYRLVTKAVWIAHQFMPVGELAEPSLLTLLSRLWVSQTLGGGHDYRAQLTKGITHAMKVPCPPIKLRRGARMWI